MRSRCHRGFTILELIVNFTIIGILTAIAVPAYMNFRDKARVAQARGDLRKIQAAIEVLAIDTNKWPGAQDVGVVADKEVWNLNSAKAGLTKSDRTYPNWRGPYMKSVPKDPWGMDYFFDPDYPILGTKHPVIGSFGPNKCCRNRYDSDDVILKLPTN